MSLLEDEEEPVLPLEPVRFDDEPPEELLPCRPELLLPLPLMPGDDEPVELLPLLPMPVVPPVPAPMLVLLEPVPLTLLPVAPDCEPWRPLRHSLNSLENLL